MRKLVIVVLLLVLLLGLALAVLSNGRQAQPFPTGSESATRLQPGLYAVHQHDEEFVDASRPSDGHGDYEGADERRLAGTVWHPADNSSGPYPLVVYSHGFSSMKEGGAYLARQLASLGYVVVSVNYPLTHIGAPGGPWVRDVVNQPGDVSFLIDTLLEQSGTAGHMLEGMVDASRIGVTGISLGGLTTTLAAFHPTMGDDRIGAALSIAGPTNSFTEVFFSHRRVPFLMLAADIDAMVDYDSNAVSVLDRVPGSQLVTIHNGSHTGFAGPAAPLRWLNNPDALGCFMVLRNIGDGMEDPWYELLGTPEQGIDYNAGAELCTMDPLPAAMNPLRQHMIASVVVSSFFQSHFSPSSMERISARYFLGQVLAAELEEVSYARAR